MSRPSGYHHTPESKEKIRKAMLGRKFSAETLERMRTASKERGAKYIGDGNPAWKGGTYLSRQRVMQYVGPGKHVPRARLVLEQKLGRPLAPSENAHHLNENQSDDSPANLDVMVHDEHARHHANRRPRDPRTKRWL